MKARYCLVAALLFPLFVACTEDIVIDTEEGEPMVGVEACFTDETKRHEAILSYTSGFYEEGTVRMVSGATVFVTDGMDTVPYVEDAERPGHYFTGLVAGTKNKRYEFHAYIPDEQEDEGVLHLVSESYMRDNVEVIDSLVVKPYNGPNDTVPTVFYDDTVEFVYPYFQSLSDPSLVYMPMVYKNDSLLTDTLSRRMIVPMGGFAGFYVNGAEMQAINKEIPVFYFRKKSLKEGDRIRVDLYSIPEEYLYFVYNLNLSAGSNPLFGAPANVVTNIQPSQRAVGWFLTASVVSAETVFRDLY